MPIPHDAELSADGVSPALVVAMAQLAEGVIVTDAQGRITFVNAAAARLHGVARLDVAPDEYADSYHLLTESGLPYPSTELPLARAVLRGETVLEARWRIRRPDGSEILAVGNARPIRAADGSAMGAVLTVRDETARYDSEVARAAQNAQLRTQSAELELANEHLQDSAAELEAQAEELNATAAQLEERTEEAELARRLAESERARAEELLATLQVERARLADVFQQAPVAVAVLRGRVAAELVFELANPRFLELTPPGRMLVDARLRDVLHELSDVLLGEMQRVLDTGVPFVANGYLVPLDRDNDGVPEDYYFNFVYHPLVEPDGSVSGIVAVGTDVTESVQARRDAERLRAEAEAANVAKSAFLAVMSHELRTPLNAIGGYAELIELGIRGPVTVEQAADLARIQRSQRHLLGLIDGVLNFARVEGGHVQYEIADVSLDDVLTTCEALVAPQARARQQVLRYPGSPATVTVRADAEKLQQIVLNLLSNAIKFSEPGGAIMLTGEDGAAFVTVRVNDRGRGIPADQLERIFHPFVQVDAKLTRTKEGTGLGLAISRDLARGMGGDLTVDSTPGVGSTFTLTIPHAR
ncbi:MAG: ATP-binding protein [Gemmatimonadaceae bacterium]